MVKMFEVHYIVGGDSCSDCYVGDDWGRGSGGGGGDLTNIVVIVVVVKVCKLHCVGCSDGCVYSDGGCVGGVG